MHQANGALGTVVFDQLVKGGFEVTALVRSSGKIPNLPASAKEAVVDFTSHDSLVAALKDLHPSPPTPPEVPFQTVCLVTPETVDVASIKTLRRAYDVVVGVEIIEQEDDRKLRLLGKSPSTSSIS